MDKVTEFRLRAKRLTDERTALDAEINDYLKGRRVRILTNYNGQPYGSSRSSLRGKVLTISHAYSIDSIGRELDPILICFPRLQDSLELLAVEFLEEE